MTIVAPIRRPAPEMTEADFRAVFGPWADWIMESAEVKNAHPDYVALALLSATGAIIGNTRWVVPWDGWKEPPVLWAMLVGEPSSGKSPALDAVLDPIKEIDRDLARDFRADRLAWQDKEELAKFVRLQWKADAKSAIADGATPPEKPREANVGKAPVRERIGITDITIEMLAQILSETWRGLLLFRDELSGWMGSMDRYSGGGDRPFWLEAYGGRSYTVDRKANPDPITVEHLSISILGGTQPDKLESLLLKTEDDGLLARFLVVFPDPVPIKRPAGGFDGETPRQAFKRLRSLQPAMNEHGEAQPISVHLNAEAQDALQAFRLQCRKWESEANGLLKSHIGKFPGLAVRVSLNLAYLDWAIGADAAVPVNVGANHMARARLYVGEHLRQHAERAYGTASVPSEVQGARRIAKIIQQEQLTEIGTREIQRREIAGLQTAAQISAAMAVLVEAAWVAQKKTKTGGRPRKLFDVNPKIGGAK